MRVNVDAITGRNSRLSFSCRRSRVASTMSGAKHVSGSKRQTYASVTPSRCARSVIDFAFAVSILRRHRTRTQRLDQRVVAARLPAHAPQRVDRAGRALDRYGRLGDACGGPVPLEGLRGRPWFGGIDSRPPPTSARSPGCSRPTRTTTSGGCSRATFVPAENLRRRAERDRGPLRSGSRATSTGPSAEPATGTSRCTRTVVRSSAWAGRARRAMPASRASAARSSTSRLVTTSSSSSDRYAAPRGTSRPTSTPGLQSKSRGRGASRRASISAARRTLPPDGC